SEANMAPLRILVAGAGLFGCEHLDRLVKRNDVRIVGVADPNPEALARLRGRTVLDSVSSDAGAMLDLVPADGIIVASSSAPHVEIQRKPLPRGLAVFLKKPWQPNPAMAVTLRPEGAKPANPALPGP